MLSDTKSSGLAGENTLNTHVFSGKNHTNAKGRFYIFLSCQVKKQICEARRSQIKRGSENRWLSVYCCCISLTHPSAGPKQVNTNKVVCITFFFLNINQCQVSTRQKIWGISQHKKELHVCVVGQLTVDRKVKWFNTGDRVWRCWIVCRWDAVCNSHASSSHVWQV